MTVEETLKDAEHKMRGSISFAQEELASAGYKIKNG